MGLIKLIHQIFYKPVFDTRRKNENTREFQKKLPADLNFVFNFEYAV